jgi:hypothetical protein
MWRRSRSTRKPRPTDAEPLEASSTSDQEAFPELHVRYPSGGGARAPSGEPIGAADGLPIDPVLLWPRPTSDPSSLSSASSSDADRSDPTLKLAAPGRSSGDGTRLMSNLLIVHR